MKTREEKVEAYKTMCYQYGLTAILVILRQYDDADNFDECQIILDSLNAIEGYTIQDMPKIWGKNSQFYFIKLLRLITGRDGIEVFNYLEKHIQVIKDYVK